MHPRLQSLAALAALVLLAAGCSTLPPPREVTVSSANYATTSIDELAKFINQPSALNPNPPALQPLAQPKLYIFAPGEVYASDVPFKELCRQLEAALGQKGYLNLVTEVLTHHRKFEPPELVLRVHCGERPWRNPVIRVDELTWNEGLLARHRMASGGSGAVTLWDFRAGGDDAGLYAVEQALGAAEDPGHPLNGLAMSLGQPPTRDYFLVVVEAFLFADLRTKHGEARRLWTTFVAVPKQGSQKYSEVLAGLLRTAMPYFGETTRGIQVFDQDHATVKIGVPYEVTTPQTPPATAPLRVSPPDSKR